MAALFQSFRSSSMPKRLLRYALSRLELLDAEALDIENLDFALGRNTVFEFRDVGLKLKKLERLLQLPAAFGLQRAKVLLLRVTVPMDFYTSPITVEVDGVDVRLKIDVADRRNRPGVGRDPATTSSAAAVPNTVDLAQSFLETQPSSERRRLEEALVAENQDLGASISVSDDDSNDDEPAVGTGQALSLPDFLADFLQGIVDRMQVRIKRVKFQLDLEVPADAASSTPEPISFQLALEDIEVEGVTATATTTPTQDDDAELSPPIVPKVGKRHVSLANVRAYLISEANVFSALSRSPSMASPSVASSPTMMRTPPSRQASSLSQGSFREQPMASLQQSFRQHLSDRDEFPDPDCHLGDSEVALGIPYDFKSASNDGPDDECPPTPRGSIFKGSSTLPGEPPLFPAIDSTLSHKTRQKADALLASELHQGPLSLRPSRAGQSKSDAEHDDEESAVASPERTGSAASSTEDLTASHLYTHEEAESMYLSAFSTANSRASVSASRLAPSRQQYAAQPALSSVEAPHSPPSPMPGAWDNESERSHDSQTGPRAAQCAGTCPIASHSGRSSPSFSGAASIQYDSLPAAAPATETEEHDNAATPKGATRVVKEIMNLKTVSIYIPSQQRHIHVHPVSNEPVAAQQSQSLGTSICPQAPGAFSTHAVPSLPPDSPPSLPQNASENGKDNALEVILSPLGVYFDASLGFLLAMVVEKLLQALKREAPVGASADADSQSRRQPLKRAPEIRVAAQEISLNFLNQLSGVADTCERHLSALPFVPDGDEVLLNTTLQNLVVSIYPTDTMTLASPDAKKHHDQTEHDAVTVRVNLQRLRFGYTDGDIVSFDSGKPIATSVRETFLSTGNDVGIKLVRSATGIMTTDIETLPLVVQIDLRRLDETFGWFGGLSSFLNMSASSSASISSGVSPPSPTLRSTAPVASTSRRPKGVVHFEVPSERHPGDHRSVAAAQNKVNVRIGGALIELVGRDCSVAAETNAIKIVGRDEGIGVACSRVRVSGPYLKNRNKNSRGGYDDNDPGVTTEVGGVRLEFSTAPKDRDLEKLLELIIPSKVKFDDGRGDDEIMVDTLLRQRRKGSVLRATFETVNVRVRNVAQLSPALPNLGEEIAKLSTVAKYLPEDDRPGLLTLARLQKLGVIIDDVGGRIGHLEGQVGDIEVGHITLPSLVAVSIRGVSIRRNGTEDLVSSPAFDSPDQLSPDKSGPVIMARAIGDEMEPTVKLKLRNVRVEYSVTTILDVLGLDQDSTTSQDFEACLSTSVANLSDRVHATLFMRQPLTTVRNSVEQGGAGKEKEVVKQEIGEEEKEKRNRKSMLLDIGLRDCLLGLNPLNLPSKLVVAFTDGRLQTKLSPVDGRTTWSMNINKASILLTDNAAETETASSVAGNARRQRRRSSASAASPQVASMCAKGFVDICYMSSASVTAAVKPARDGGNGRQVEVELRDDLLVLETCADSTQTLIALANALTPPTPPTKEEKYRTKVMPVQDLLASISAEAFGRPEGEYDFDQDFAMAQELAGSGTDAGQGSSCGGGNHHPPGVDSHHYGEQYGSEELFDATMQDSMLQHSVEGVLVAGFKPSTQEGQASDIDSSDDLVIHEDFYARDESRDSHTATIWNSTKNTYDKAPNVLVEGSPLKVSVRDVHVIWNLFDGYDWAYTREIITKAVEEVETKALERQQVRLGGGGGGGGGGAGPQAFEEQLEDEETIGDFLFNSIYIGVPVNRDPRELTRAINEGLDDNATETDSLATATTNKTALRYHQHHQSKHGPRRRLRLNRSKHHKITFELRGVNVDMITFPPPETAGQETLSSIDVRVQTLDIFDHVPTSTWKKFATYDQDRGAREMGTSMVHLELLNVRPHPELAASEIVMRATVLPLRLHVDQDALDFITRFFEFKNETASSSPPPCGGGSGGDVPFLQRAEVNDIPVKLDFKPKRVDYAGLRSGHTTEFMNFVVLEEARMVLRHVIVYGVSGFDRLGRTLNDIWMPDVRKNQLPGVVAGLAPVRSLVNIGSGFRDLIEIPLREYRRDGRVVRSISKGAAAFARTTGTELVKLGAKLAVGTQYALQGAEEMLLTERQQQQQQQQSQQQQQDAADGSWEDGGADDDDGLDLEPDDRKHISLYAEQPTGVLQGIRGGYRSLTRDVNLARDAIIAVPGEVMESQTAGGAARAVWRRAPTIIFRPAVGVTKAIGQTLMGATNTIDPQNRRRVGEKYKH